MGNKLFTPLLSCTRPTSSDKSDFLSKYTLGRTIGSGSFGKILEATESFTFRTVAVKYISKKDVETMMDVNKQSLPAEAVILDTLDHPNIISLVDLFVFKKKFALVLERPLASMDLSAFLTHLGPQNDETCSYIAQQLLSAVDYLDQNLIFHRDIKSENLLINTYTNEIKLIDFGSSTYANRDVFTGAYGTPAFAPPEWIMETGYRAEPTTIWSCGVVLFEVLTARLPFTSEEDVIRGPLTFPDLISRPARDFLKRMLQKKDWERITISDALRHPYVSEGGKPEEYTRILDDTVYSRCSAFTVLENMSFDPSLL
eukprot:sb/3467020/